MNKTTPIILALSCMLPVMLCQGADQFPNGFHNGGVGACDGCHTRTNTVSQSDSSGAFKNSSTASGTPMPEAKNPNLRMFNGQDPSSTCLICHTAPKGQRVPSGYFVATNNEDISSGLPPAQMSPGGDFAWLRKTFRWASRDSSTIKDGLSQGDHHGHNIIATQFGYTPDFSNAAAPGGSYPSEKLSCVSCHDPHGSYRRLFDGSISTNGAISIIASGSYKSSPIPDATHAVGSYRLLAGKGYSPRTTGASVVLTADPPAAIAPDTYNRMESKYGDTRVAYGRDMSEWCQNCHRPHNHPTGNSASINSTYAKQYNSYVASGNMGGSRATSYSSLVPFEVGTRDYAELKRMAGSGGNGADLNGPKSGENIMCLTCHRAHASGWDAITRWNTKTELIAYNGKYPGIDADSPSHIAQGRTSAETRKAYYDRPVDSFALYQRGLCSKCHAKD
jgi:hypothetical protein